MRLILTVAAMVILAAPAWAQNVAPPASPNPVAPGQPAPPTRPAAPADPRKTELDSLLTALKTAPNEAAATVIERRVRQIWVQSGSAAATLLMNRGMRDLSNEAGEEAEADFDAVLVLEPQLADAYYRRALARSAVGDYRGALSDIEETLKREPRHFAALQSLSRIAESHDDFKGALAAWKKALELSPKTEDAQERLKLLERKAFGQAT